mmetsp:Transcript_16086/g.23277  ORF Transcript_16086/g.23277 Transcript_16086/m.23277 type:complete len:158 (+) Transcript_16086:922-1395(+)
MELIETTQKAKLLEVPGRLDYKYLLAEAVSVLSKTGVGLFCLVCLGNEELNLETSFLLTCSVFLLWTQVTLDLGPQVLYNFSLPRLSAFCKKLKFAGLLVDLTWGVYSFTILITQSQETTVKVAILLVVLLFSLRNLVFLLKISCLALNCFWKLNSN